MLNSFGIFAVTIIVLTLVSYPFLAGIYGNYKMNKIEQSFFSSPAYIAYKEQHDKGEAKNRIANKRYTYNEKYVDYTYQKFELFDRENIHFNHHNMPSFYVGAFEGTAECTPNDSMNGTYMASIYDGQHIFINKIEINQQIFDYIIKSGGCVMAYGNIKECDENYITHNVYVTNRWWDKNERKLRIYHGEVFIESGSKSKC